MVRLLASFLALFWMSYLITHFPGGILAEIWVGKYFLSVGILSTAFFALISPLAAKQDPDG